MLNFFIFINSSRISTHSVEFVSIVLYLEKLTQLFASLLGFATLHILDHLNFCIKKWESFDENFLLFAGYQFLEKS